jgi:hypothetical protein
MILTTTRKVEMDPKLIEQLKEKFMTPEYKFPKDDYIKNSEDTNPPEDYLNTRIYSSWDDMQLPHFPADVESFYYNLVSDVLSEVGLLGRIHAVNSKWCQIYTHETTGHGVHTHCGGQEFISWVHFVSAPTDQKCFFFVNSDSKKVYPEQDSGTVLFFAPWMMHGVEPVEASDNPRIVVAGNIVARQYKPVPYADLTFNIENNHGKVTWEPTGDTTHNKFIDR